MAFAAFFMTSAQTGEGLFLRHDLGTQYNRTDYDSACGSTVFRVRFRNGPEEHGRVDYLLIDGRPIPDAAETLQIRAARRVIDKIEIMNCGMDPQRPVFRGVMALSKIESQGLGMRPSLYFRISRDERNVWQFVLD
jgi:hypothetical protein